MAPRCRTPTSAHRRWRRLPTTPATWASPTRPRRPSTGCWTMWAPAGGPATAWSTPSTSGSSRRPAPAPARSSPGPTIHPIRMTAWSGMPSRVPRSKPVPPAGIATVTGCPTHGSDRWGSIRPSPTTTPTSMPTASPIWRSTSTRSPPGPPRRPPSSVAPPAATRSPPTGTRTGSRRGSTPCRSTRAPSRSTPWASMPAPSDWPRVSSPANHRRSPSRPAGFSSPAM